MPVSGATSWLEVDLFTSSTNNQLLNFLTWTMVIMNVVPDVFTVDWSRWCHIYIFPSPSTNILLWVCLHFRRLRSEVAIVTPLWMTQLLCLKCLSWCPDPLPFGRNCLMLGSQDRLEQPMRLHTWIFSRPAYRTTILSE